MLPTLRQFSDNYGGGAPSISEVRVGDRSSRNQTGELSSGRSYNGTECHTGGVKGLKSTRHGANVGRRVSAYPSQKTISSQVPRHL